MAKNDINDDIDKLDLEELGSIDSVDVFSDVRLLAGAYGRCSELALRASNGYSVAKTRLEQLEGQIDIQVRKTLELSGEKITEGKVKSAIRSAQPWVAQKNIVDEAEGRLERCKSALRTLDKKERMLDILGRFQIREYGVNQRTAQ